MMYRWITLLVGSLLLLVNIRPAAAAETASIKLSVQPFFAGKYRAGDWIPLRITVTNTGTDVTAEIGVQAGTSFATMVDLPGGAEKSVVLYARPLDEIRRTATVRAVAEGAEVARVDVPISGFSALTHVVGYITQQSLTLPLPTSHTAGQKLENVALQPTDIPERGEGLAMFDLIVVDGAPLTNLNPNQQQALADWVRTGGQLILGGTELENTLGQLPEILRPAAIDGVAPQGQISLLTDLSADQSPAATALTGKSHSRIVATIGTTPVGIQQEVGAGRVTVLGFGFSAPELSQLTATPALWEQIASLRTSTTTAQQGQQPDDVQGQQFASILTLLPVLAIPPLTTLAVLLGLYLLIIGPGLYFLLRRLDRQAWGWIAVPLVTIVFSLGAYGYGMQLRGNESILNQVTVVETAAGRARVRTYAGLFSPRTLTYQISANGDALFEPMMGSGFGPGGAALTGGQYIQGNSSIRDLSIPQWSMRTFMGQQMMDLSPLQAELTLEGTTIRGTIRNTGTDPIHDIAFVHDVQAFEIGDLQPGQSQSIEFALDQNATFNRDVGVAGQLLKEKLNVADRAGQPSVEARMQQTMVDTLFNPLFDPPSEPVLLGWLDRSPLQIDVTPSRVQHQQLTALVAAVDLEFSQSGPVTLTRGWFDPTFEVGGVGMGGPCITRSADGWYVDTGVITSTLQLPANLQPAQVDQAAIIIDRDGPPSELKVGVYDWTSAQWVEQALTDTTAPLDQPARYFSPTGLLKARVETLSEGPKGGGCVSINLQVEGRPQ